MSMKQVNLMHMFLVGPLLLYIGNKKEKNRRLGVLFFSNINIYVAVYS